MKMMTVPLCGRNFHTPPAFQGQMVERSFALGGEWGEYIVLRTIDHATREAPSYECFACPVDEEGDCWDAVPELEESLGPCHVTD